MEGETFQVFIRPFHIRHKDKNFGSITVTTTSDTFYEIDGQSYEGSDGLKTLSGKPVRTPMIIIGDLKLHPDQPHRFEAREVYAGTSVPWSKHDVVTGNVIKREGNILTVRGMTIVKENSSVVFKDNITVELGPETKISCQAIICEAAYIDDISIGQRITVFGLISGRQSGSLSLDATTGHVRMLVTTIRGEVLSAQSGYLVIDLQSINHQNVAIFDFTGTGTSSDQDADPTNYEIDTGALDFEETSPSDPVKVKGFVSSFGSAPGRFQCSDPDQRTATITAIYHSFQSNQGRPAGRPYFFNRIPYPFIPKTALSKPA